MKTRTCYSLTFALILIALLASACAPAAAPTTAPIASSGREEKQNARPQPAATAMPEATSAPRIQQPAAQIPYAAQPTAASAPPQDNYFEDAGVNPAEDTRRDHLSTFSLDVDTASYSVTRTYINDGYLPPYDAIRLEEFVNSFDQGYAAPYENAFTVYADGAPAPQGFEGGGYVLRFGVQGYRVAEWERKPMALTFVIDVSGSMGDDNRLELVKDSLRLLVDRLDGGDTVAIVAYSTDARVALDVTRGDDREAILSVIGRLTPENSTNAEAGLRLGYKLAMRAYQAGATNRVILCSDGVANTGNTDPEVILSEVEGYVSEGITLTAIGVGMGNFNDVLLESLADRGDGNYAYVDTIDQARKVFVDDLTATMQVIAKDAKVQVDFNPDVTRSYRLLGYENRAVADSDFRDNAVDAGEIGAGHSATALYYVELQPGASGRIATVQLRWQDPDSGQVKEINGNFNTFDLAERFEDAAPRYQLAVTVAQFAEILRESPYTVDLSLRDLARRAQRIARSLPEDEQVKEFADLARRAAEIGR